MYQDDEVLSFRVTFGKRNEIEVLKKLSHFNKAPYGMKEDTPQEELNTILFRFFNSRAIAPSRWDYDRIIKNTGCKDSFELAFKGHGLSLSNHYWYKKEGESLKYKDINFFTNKWDDSFARAVLSGNYEALKDVDLNVPDIVTTGWAVKGWLYEEDEAKLYKLGIAKDHIEEPLSEVLASRLAKRLFNNSGVVEYELKEVYGKYASASKTMIGIDEELVPLSSIVSVDLYALFRNKDGKRSTTVEFLRRIDECGVPHIHEFFVKVLCLKSLAFVNDLHFDNISVIRNIKTGEIRIAPLYDLGGAFGSSETGKKILSNVNKATYIIIYYIYGYLDPNWDYSWYNPDSLNGFENEIKEILSKSDFYNIELINNIIDVYRHQKQSLDEMALASKKK